MSEQQIAQPEADRQLTALLFDKLRLVMAEMDKVPKLGTAPSSMGGYKFARDPEVKEAVRKGMIEHNLMWIPGCTGVTQAPNVKGNQLHTHSNFSVTLVDCETGYTWTIPWFGEVLDTSDKGFGKSATLGFKYLWLTMFMVATGDDPDAGSLVHGASGSATGIEPVQPADPKTFKLKFGKHKGKTVAEVGSNPDDAGWLEWALDNLDDDERNAELLATIRAYFGIADGTTQPPSSDGAHWTATQDWAQFYTYASSLGLDNPAVHAALEVESAKSFTGTKPAALWALLKYAQETVKDWATRQPLIDQWYKWLNSLPNEQRPSPAEAANILVETGNLSGFNDTFVVAKNIVLAKI